jgi:transmembrane sensor
VLGTEFGVRAYRAAPIRVAVQDGRVAVGGAIVGAHDIAHVHGGTVSVTHAATLDSEFAFARGELVFAETPLAEAIPDLNRWYDADVRLGDATLGAQRLTGTLANGTRADLARHLGAILNARVVHVGKTLTIYPR